MKTAVLLLLLAAALAAQDLGRKAPPQARATAIVNATIHPVSGPAFTSGAVVFDGGVITWVGPTADLRTPDDAVRIDATGKHVYPGLIAAVTQLGLVEVGSIAATQDHSEVGEVTPETRAVVAVNPDSAAIPVTRSNGVLTAGVFPRGGLVSGRAGVIRLDGWTCSDMTVADDIGMVAQWPVRPPRRGAAAAAIAERDAAWSERLRRLDATFAAARAYVAARAADPSLPTDVRGEAMRAIVSGQRPLFVFADDVDSIEAATLWAEREHARLIIVGGRDAPLCGDLLVRRAVAVIVTGTHRLPKRRDSAYDEAFTLPAQLEAAKVRWCLASSGDFANERNLPYDAATAVAHGLAPDAALRAITLSAAEILGVADHLGSLDLGKAATLFIADGDPLEITTHVERAFVDGRDIDLRNRQTELAEKYRDKYRQLGLLPR